MPQRKLKCFGQSLILNIRVLSARILAMPISASAKKSLRVANRNHKVNVTFKTNLRLTIKKFLASPSSEGLKDVFSILDKAVKNNLFHKNKTARLKSEYNKIADGKVQVAKVAVKKKSAKKIAAKKKLAKKMK